MNTTRLGNEAESAAARFLQERGYRLLERNWRTRYCEIDIVARQGEVVAFVEVKYRTRTAQGSGLDYITARKLKQMQFAAQLWVQEHGWKGDYQLSAIEVTGQALAITAFISDCD